MIGLFIGLAIMLAGGLGCAGWLIRRRATSVLEIVGLSIILGSVATSLLVGICSLGLRGTALIGVVTALCLAAAISGGLRLRRCSIDPLPGQGWVVLAIALMSAFVGWQAFAKPLGGDGLFNFEFRAHLAFLHGGAVPPAFFSDASRSWMHPEYPLFVPFCQTWIYLWIGEPHQGLVKSLGVFWFVGAACLVAACARRISPVGVWIALGALALTPSLTLAPGGAAWTWADFPLGACAAAGGFYFLTSEEEPGDTALFAVFLGALPWIKREGVLIGAVLLLCFAVRTRDLGRVTRVALPFLGMFIGWKVVASSVGAISTGDFAFPGWEGLVDRLDRLPRIATFVAFELVVIQRWGLFWILVLLAIAQIWRRPDLSQWRPLALGILALLAAYSGIYLFGTWPDVLWHMLTSFPRIIMPLAMLAIPVLVVAIKMPPKPQILPANSTGD